jgi:hypothetical protein
MVAMRAFFGVEALHEHPPGRAALPRRPNFKGAIKAAQQRRPTRSMDHGQVKWEQEVLHETSWSEFRVYAVLVICLSPKDRVNAEL